MKKLINTFKNIKNYYTSGEYQTVRAEAKEQMQKYGYRYGSPLL